MKNKLILIICSVLLYTVSTAQKTPAPVVITGNIAEKGTYKQIYLDTLNGQNPWIFVSSAIDSDGNFKLVANITNADIFRLRLDDKNYMMLILTPGEKVSMKIKGSKLGGDAMIEGSVHTQLLYTAMNTTQQFENRKAALNQQYNQIQTAPNRDSLSALIINQFRTNDSLQKTALKADKKGQETESKPIAILNKTQHC